MRFPLGEALKRDVAAAAAAPFSGLRVLAKPQSMGVCFIGRVGSGQGQGGVTQAQATRLLAYSAL